MNNILRLFSRRDSSWKFLCFDIFIHEKVHTVKIKKSQLKYRVRYQNPDKFQFKFSAILCLRQRLLLASKSLMLLVNNHILKMAAMLKSSAEYNRRAAIIEGLRAGRSATKIIRFFGYPRSIIYNIMTKYMTLE